MNTLTDVAKGIQLRGLNPSINLQHIRLLVLGMDSAMLYPGVQEFAAACRDAGMEINTSISEAKDGTEKLRLLIETCTALHIGTQEVLVVGRSESDVLMMESAGVSIAFMASTRVNAAADLIVESPPLDRALQWLTLAAAEGPAELDLTVLEKMVGNDPVKFRKFALLFIESIDTVLALIDSAVAAKDLPALMGLGHRAKSTAKSIGAEAFSGQCLLLEQTARSGDLPTALEIAGHFRPQFETIRQIILQRLDSHA